MAQFKEAVLTRKGIALLAKAQAEKKSIAFTRAVTGNGIHEDGEDIARCTELAGYQQEFAPTTIARQNETNVYVRFSITNNPSYGPLEHGYYVTEIGLMADDPDEGEILYGLAIGEEGKCDYLPAYNNLLPAVIGVDFLIEVDNAENVTIVTDLSAYATNEDLDAKADRIAFDEETNEVLLKANGEVISRCVIPFDKIDLSDYAKKEDLEPYAKKDDLSRFVKEEDLEPYEKTEDTNNKIAGRANGVSFDKNTGKLSLLSDGEEIDNAKIDIPEGGASVSLASEDDVREMGESLLRVAGGTVDDNARVAEPDEVEEAINNLVDI